MRLINLESHQVIAEEVEGAYTFWARFKGLMFTKHISEAFALHIKPCRSIHTFFMNYRIDVIYLNKQNVIVGIEEGLDAGKIGGKFAQSHSVIELPAGKINQTSTTIGQTLAFVDGSKEQVS